MATRTGIGQDSHRFLNEGAEKPCIIAGTVFDDAPGFDANSDGDVVYHALCNAVTSLTGVVIMGGIADKLCLEEGITDSRIYLKKALETLGGQKIVHAAVTLEGKRPKFRQRYDAMRAKIAEALGIELHQVGLTATSGEGLTGFGRGEGVQCFSLLTVEDQ